MLLLFVRQSFAQLTEIHYKIYDVKSSTEVTVQKITEKMRDYDVLFFGEEHNDSVAHYLEYKILESMHGEFKDNLALSLEMFDRDLQTVMNEYLGGMIREKNFTKDARVWSNYRDYRPLVEFAKDKKLDVICANAPSRYSNLASRKGQQALADLSPEAKKFLAPLPYELAAGKYLEKLTALTSHDASAKKDTTVKNKSHMPSSFNLVMGQSLWDATMAYSIAQYLRKNKGKKILQVNGRFHSDEGFAIVEQLKKYSSKTKSLIISVGSDDDYPNIDWNKHKNLGDFIIITDPKIPKTY